MHLPHKAKHISPHCFIFARKTPRIKLQWLIILCQFVSLAITHVSWEKDEETFAWLWIYSLECVIIDSIWGEWGVGHHLCLSTGQGVRRWGGKGQLNWHLAKLDMFEGGGGENKRLWTRQHCFILCYSLFVSLPPLHSPTEQVVKVIQHNTQETKKYTCDLPPHTHTHRYGTSSYNTRPLCASKRSVSAQGSAQDEGAEGVNFNLIKWVGLLISYGDICCSQTMTLW